MKILKWNLLEFLLQVIANKVHALNIAKNVDLWVLTEALVKLTSYMKLTVHHRKERGHYKKVQVLHMMEQGQNRMVPLEIRTRCLVLYNQNQEHYIHHLGHNNNRHILRIWDVFVSFCIHGHRRSHHHSPCDGGVGGSVCVFCVVDAVLDDAVVLSNHLFPHPQVPPGMMHIPWIYHGNIMCETFLQHTNKDIKQVGNCLWNLPLYYPS